MRCGSLDQVPAKSLVDSYESRRQVPRREFEPLLSALESFDVSPLEELVSSEAQRLNSASHPGSVEEGAGP